MSKRPLKLKSKIFVELIYDAVEEAREITREAHEGTVPVLVELLEKRSLKISPPLVEDLP